MKFDYKELQLQRKEEILKSGHYARIEIIVPLFSMSNDGSDIPVVEMELHKTNKITTAYLTRVLEDISNLIIREYELEHSRKVIDEGIKSTTSFIPKE